MVDVFPVDFTTEVGRVRKYIPDLQQLPDPRDPSGPATFIFSDGEIQSFILDEVGTIELPAHTWQLRRAAAWAILSIANNENLILKKITTEDQATDGPAVANALRTVAADLFKLADEERSRFDVGSFLHVPYNDPVSIPEPRGVWTTWPYPGVY